MEESVSFDVVIVGAGPAGASAAVSLRRCFPQLSVGLLESTRFDQPRPGEVLPSVASSLLSRLGVWHQFLEARFRPAPSLAVSWGSPRLVERPSLFSPWGDGWHLDRARFDSLLAQAAVDQGANLKLATRIAAARRTRGGWSLRLTTNATWRARFVLDATGRSASFARSQGAKKRSIDRLVGLVRFFPTDSDADSRTLIEAAAQGWWYSARLSTHRVVALMSDVDLARDLKLAHTTPWRRLQGDTLWIRRLVASSDEDIHCSVRPAGSGYITTVRGRDWMAVGDAGFSVDPLSGSGMVRALRAGILAGYAIGPHLLEGDHSGLVRFEKLHWQELADYLSARRNYFAEERRWPTEPFWKRRHAEHGAVGPEPGFPVTAG